MLGLSLALVHNFKPSERRRKLLALILFIVITAIRKPRLLSCWVCRWLWSQLQTQLDGGEILSLDTIYRYHGKTVLAFVLGLIISL